MLDAGGARNRAMSIRISWNICRGTAASAICWGATRRGIAGWRLTPMNREPIGTGRLPAPGGCQATISASIGVDLPMPEKPTSLRRDGGLLGRWHFRYLTQYNAGSGDDQAGAA